MASQNSGKQATAVLTARHALRERTAARARAMSVVFVIAMIVVVAVGLWVSSSGLDESASRRLARLRLVDTVTGDRAVAEISRLHGEGAGVTGGYVAHYQGASGDAVLYVGKTASEQDAAALVERLRNRVASEGDHFTGLEPRTVEGTGVLSVLRDGEPQYFWRARSLVIWLGFQNDYPAGLAAAVKALH